MRMPSAAVHGVTEQMEKGGERTGRAKGGSPTQRIFGKRELLAITVLVVSGLAKPRAMRAQIFSN